MDINTKQRKAYNLIGSKAPKKITPEIFHKVKVIDRKRDICKVEIDKMNGCYEPHEQILPPTFKGTHPKKSILKTIKSWLQQLLP